MTLPETMTAILIEGKGGGPEVLKAASRPVPSPKDQELLVKVAAAGVNRPDVLQRPAITRRRPAPPTFPGSKSPAKWWRPEPVLRAGRLAIRSARSSPGGGYAEYCRADERACLPVPVRLRCRRGRGASGDLFHRLAQRVRARRPEARRDAACSWRLERHRHDRDPACQGLRRHGLSRPPDQRREMRGLRTARRRPGDQLPRRGFRRGRSKRRPAGRASMSFSTWSAATMSHATSRPPRMRGASSDRLPVRLESHRRFDAADA